MVSIHAAIYIGRNPTGSLYLPYKRYTCVLGNAVVHSNRVRPEFPIPRVASRAVARATSLRPGRASVIKLASLRIDGETKRAAHALSRETEAGVRQQCGEAPTA